MESITPGTFGEPNGRGSGGGAFGLTFAANPKYETNGNPSAVSATALPCPMSSCESTT